jgi:hypothetical protein
LFPLCCPKAFDVAFQNHTLDTATKNLIFGTELLFRLRPDDDSGVMMMMMMAMVPSSECWHRRAQQQNTSQ